MACPSCAYGKKGHGDARLHPAGSQEVLGVIPPGEGLATIEKIAINAVMAGCLPEYLPVVINAGNAMLDKTV